MSDELIAGDTIGVRFAQAVGHDWRIRAVGNSSNGRSGWALNPLQMKHVQQQAIIINQFVRCPRLRSFVLMGVTLMDMLQRAECSPNPGMHNRESQIHGHTLRRCSWPCDRYIPALSRTGNYWAGYPVVP